MENGIEDGDRDVEMCKVAVRSGGSGGECRVRRLVQAGPRVSTLEASNSQIEQLKSICFSQDSCCDGIRTVGSDKSLQWCLRVIRQIR